MAFFDFFKKKPKPEEVLSPFEQELTRHGLVDWFKTEFSATDRERVEAQGRATSGKAPADAVAFLRSIAPKGPIGRKVLARAEKLAAEQGDPVALFNLQDTMIDRYLRDAEADKTAMPDAEAVCDRQIATGPKLKAALTAKGTKLPRHKGLEQLAILREKQGKIEDALRYAREGKAGGWAGDWDARIQRCESKRTDVRNVDAQPMDDETPEE